MSFPPNNFQTGTNAFFQMPTPNPSPQQGNTMFSQTGSEGSGANNWFNQQNWQQQQQQQLLPQQHQQQQSLNSQPQNFFDSIPSSQTLQQAQQVPPPPQPTTINNNLEPAPNAGDGWGDWDDWNQNDTKTMTGNQGHPTQNQINDNRQWQNNQQQWNPHSGSSVPGGTLHIQQSAPAPVPTPPENNWNHVKEQVTATPQFQQMVGNSDQHLHQTPVANHQVRSMESVPQFQQNSTGNVAQQFHHTPVVKTVDITSNVQKVKPNEPSPQTPQFQQTTGNKPIDVAPNVQHNFLGNPMDITSNMHQNSQFHDVKPTEPQVHQVPAKSEHPEPIGAPSPATTPRPVEPPVGPPPIATPPLGNRNISQDQGFRRSGQIQRASVKIPSTSVTPPAPMLVPTLIPPPISDSHNFNIPDNFEVPQISQISLPNSSQNIEDSLSFVPPAPQMFENQPEEVSTNTNPFQQQSVNLEDRESFLNQENIANERDRFINQSDNLLPPPMAYQQQQQNQSQPTPNDDRNQYLQTSHLSEDDFVVLNNPSNDDDVNLPPPGLSRFVLGEPEQTGDSERHADGEDDDAIQPPPTSISSDTNRNMYPYASPIDIQVQRVVTGVESMNISQNLPQQVESREIDLDGENVEDAKQPPREEPTIGGDPSSNEPEITLTSSSNVADAKKLTDSSTGNDSDHHNRNSSKKYSSKSGKNRKRYDSDDSEGSSDRDRQQRHKEKERKRRDQDSDDGDSYRQKSSKGRDDKHRHNSSRYDDSRYETEESTRYERSSKRHDRKDRDRKHEDEIKRGGNNRRSYRGERPERRGEGDRDRRDARERSDREDNRERRRRTYEPKHGNYDENYQHYNRKNNNSWNARDSDYEKDPRYRRYNMYGAYEYDPYAYYHQHQQYFEQLRRTNPQSYAEWYRKYYGQMQAESLGGTDCRESVHSGRSSAAGHVNDKDRPDNMSNLGGKSVVQEDLQEDLQPGRLTPYKFSNDHAVLSLVSGVLVCVKPKYSHSNGLQNIVKLVNISPNDSTKKLFQAFPGPLVKGITHKKTVIEYCEERIKNGPTSSKHRSYQSSSNSLQSLSSSQASTQSSYVLLWNLLILLLRQNGVVVGTDIAELLVKNQKLFPYENPSKRNSIDSIEKEAKESNESNTSEVEDGEINEDDLSDEKLQLNDEEITEKFRNYLLYGNVKEALEWATDNNLWGHALFLASKVDKRLHANVMMKFANKLQLNDPLQTLYQLMSGRCPSSVTSVQDEKWGDWRPHLAMIISNTTQSPELNRKAITSLGDSLLSRDLFAAQFCFLMAQVGFGKYSSSTDSMTSANMIRLVLLGSSHTKSNSFLEFATNEAIIMTEIYEYACSLNDESFSIVEFQPYKFLLACRLLDYGFHLKALMYLEQIYVHIQKDSSKYEPSFIDKVYELADKLKFYDPVMEKTFSDNNEVQFEDQEWLKNLRVLHEQNGLSSGFANNYIPQYQQPTYDYNSYESSLPTIPETGNVQQTPQEAIPENQFQNNYYQPEPVSMTNEGVHHGDMYGNYYQHQSQHQENVQQHPEEPQQQQQQQQPPQQQIPYTPQEPYQPEQVPSYGGAYDYYNQNSAPESFQQQEQSAAPAMPSISMPNSGGGPKRSIFDDEDLGSGGAQQNIGGQQEVKKEESKKQQQQQQNKPGGSSSQNSGWFGGIWNKFSGKPKNQMILPDDKNPTIVWDAEKKKWINTDEGEDTQESFAPPPKMADLVTQVQQQHQMQQQQQQQQVQPQPHLQQPQLSQPQSATMPSSGITDPMAPIPTADPQVQTSGQTKSSGLNSNMFKMQRNRTLKKSYVDVFNPSGASTKPAESIMAPSLPPLPQSGFLVPSGGDASHQPQGTAQFYDPNAYAGNFQ